MKAIMYHYVREFSPKLPFFRYLDVKNFSRQLDFFEKEYGFVSKAEWQAVIKNKNLGSAKGKVLLTFDDAMSCHYDYVFHELKKRNLWGIFYVPTQPYQKQKILDVHRIHLLCGAFRGTDLMNVLKIFLDECMIPDERIQEFRERTYTKQENLDGVSEFKRILNYFVSYDFRELLIDKVASFFGYKFNVSDFYVSIEKLREMHSYGNIIGSHTMSHPVMSKLRENEQLEQIVESFRFLKESECIDTKTYCHPYGGFHSFNEMTINALTSEGVDYSFNVESRDIEDKDLRSAIQFLPRYDCNEFVFGKAS